MFLYTWLYGEKKKRLTRNCALHLYSGSFICLPVQSMHHQ